MPVAIQAGGSLAGKLSYDVTSTWSAWSMTA